MEPFTAAPNSLHRATIAFRESGDLAARAYLMERLYHSAVRRYSEVALDACVTLFESLDSLAARYSGSSEGQAVSFWVSCLTWSIQHRREHLLQPKRHATHVPIEACDDVPHVPQLCHESQQDARRQLLQLTRLLDELPLAQRRRAILMDRLKHGDSVRDTARRMNRAAAGIHAHLRRIRITARRCLTPFWRIV